MLLPFSVIPGIRKPSLTQSATIYVTTTGNDSYDGLSWATAKATVQGAINALPANGGVVQLGYGTFNVTSSARTDASVSYSAGTWTDTHITSGDVGSYVLGANINDAKVPKILTVIANTSFTTDVAPTGTVSNQSIIIVNPGFVLPAGVTIQGMGPILAPSNGIGSGSNSTSLILDSGSGVTCLIRGGSGSSTALYQNRLQYLSIHGNANSTLYGLYVGNFSWYLTVNNCSISNHGTAGAALDGNINSDSFYDCIFLNNGTVGANAFTGGVLAHPYYLQPSASLNFYNCFFDQNYGWGIVDPKATGAAGVGLIQCQFNVTNANAKSGSGVSAALTDHANGADAKSFIIGGWSESAALYDLDLYGSPTIINFTMASSAATNHAQITGGNAQFIGCRFENGANASVIFGSGGNIVWMGCTFNDSYFYSGVGFSNGNVPQIGTSGGSQNGQGFQLGNGNAIRMGSGSPSGGTGIVGDFYIQTDGYSASTNIYVKSGSSTWTLITMSAPVVSKSTTYSVLVNDSVILCTAGAGGFTVTLPTAVGATGKVYTIKKVDNGAGNITIATTSAQTIDGATTNVISTQYNSISVISDGSNWNII